jgi:DNA-directed RNA polymerase specialized sigma24 family protein
LDSVDRQKGKFRSFLLASLNHFLANEWDRAKAQKRGGGQAIISLDEEHAEELYKLELSGDGSPEFLFEHRWALALLDQALTRLRKEYEAAGKSAQFLALKHFLSTGSNDGAYDSVAGDLKISHGAVAVAVHRLRQRYGELVRSEVAQTVSSPLEIEEEMHHLFEVINK